MEKTTKDELLGMVDEMWEQSGKGKGKPSSDEDEYAAYWNDRIGAFKAALIQRAGKTLTADQLARLVKEGERGKAD